MTFNRFAGIYDLSHAIQAGTAPTWAKAVFISWSALMVGAVLLVLFRKGGLNVAAIAIGVGALVYAALAL